jgi:hypothetical protein
MQRFRLLRYNPAKDPVADWDEGVELEAIKCPVTPDHHRAGRRVGPLRITLERGPVPDLVWTSGSGLLVTDQVRDLFHTNHLTGFNLLPAHARWKRRQANTPPPPTLWEVQTIGWAGVARPESGIRLVERTPCCDHLRYSTCEVPSLLIDEREWDGSDFFMVWPLPLFHFVTERAARVILEHELTGGVLLDLADIELNYGFSPGRLSYWMPEGRAHLLGDAFGIS